MKYTHGETTFTVPDNPTIRQQLAYDSAIQLDNGGTPTFERLWLAFKTLVQDWKSDVIALDVDINEVSNPEAAALIEYAGLMAWRQMLELKQVPKNS